MLFTSCCGYADDVVLFCHPDRSKLPTVRELLESFGHASGLHTNFAKCSVSPIGCSEEVAQEDDSVMECLANFPIKYLGIPLSSVHTSAVCRVSPISR